MKFKNDGTKTKSPTLLDTWTTFNDGKTSLPLKASYELGIDSSDNIYISDWQNQFVLKVDSNGKWIKTFK